MFYLYVVYVPDYKAEVNSSYRPHQNESTRMKRNTVWDGLVSTRQLLCFYNKNLMLQSLLNVGISTQSLNENNSHDHVLRNRPDARDLPLLS